MPNPQTFWSGLTLATMRVTCLVKILWLLKKSAAKPTSSTHTALFWSRLQGYYSWRRNDRASDIKRRATVSTCLLITYIKWKCQELPTTHLIFSFCMRRNSSSNTFRMLNVCIEKKEKSLLFLSLWLKARNVYKISYGRVRHRTAKQVNTANKSPRAWKK